MKFPLTLVTSMVCVGAMSYACVGTPQNQTAGEAATVEAQSRELAGPEVRLVFWNDFHASLYEIDEVDNDEWALGGLPVFMAAVEALRGPGLSLLLDAGDMFQGAMPINASRGMGNIEIMNALRLDAAVIGNHEFDYGPGSQMTDDPRGALFEAIQASTFSWVSANIVAASQDVAWPPENLHAYVIISKGPYRIAVTGLTTQETPVATLAENVEGLRFESPAGTLQRIMPQILAEEPDFIVVLAHLTGVPKYDESGSEMFSGELGDIMALPEEIRQHIGLIVSGHEHASFLVWDGETLLSEDNSGGRVLTTLTLQPKLGAKGLQIERDSVRKHTLRHRMRSLGCGEEPRHIETVQAGDLTLTPDRRAIDFIARFEARMTNGRCDVMGCAETALRRSRRGECPIGNLVTNAMMAYSPQADAVMQNSGGLRADLPAGSIYRENMNSLMPFDNRFLLIEITGRDLSQVLKISSTSRHGVIQVAGLTYQYEQGCIRPEDLNGDGQIEAWENNCLCKNVTVRGEPLQADKTYQIGLSDFMYYGGDSLKGLFDQTKILHTGPIIKSLIEDYIKGHETCFSEAGLVDQDRPRLRIAACSDGYMD